MPSLIRLTALALLAALGTANADADDLERDDLPSSPHDLDAEIERLDPTRTANLFHALGPELDLFEDHAFRSLMAAQNPRIIDVELMHARDCLVDRIRGGLCVLRGFDDNAERIDVDHYGVGRAHRTRYEILERVIDSLDVLDP